MRIFELELDVVADILWFEEKEVKLLDLNSQTLQKADKTPQTSMLAEPDSVRPNHGLVM